MLKSTTCHCRHPHPSNRKSNLTARQLCIYLHNNTVAINGNVLGSIPCCISAYHTPPQSSRSLTPILEERQACKRLRTPTSPAHQRVRVPPAHSWDRQVGTARPVTSTGATCHDERGLAPVARRRPPAAATHTRRRGRALTSSCRQPWAPCPSYRRGPRRHRR